MVEWTRGTTVLLNGVEMYLPPRPKLEGYVYAATSPLVACVKIGSWMRDLDELETKFRAYYGSGIDLDWAAVRDCRATEKVLHANFADFRLGRGLGLYDKRHMEDYTEALMQLKLDPTS